MPELPIIGPILKLVWSSTFNYPFKIVLAISREGSENLCMQSQKYFIKSFETKVNKSFFLCSPLVNSVKTLVEL
jgi:hypothetical protein